MAVPRDEILLLWRALRRGLTDLKAARKALRHRRSHPVPLAEALRLDPAAREALARDASMPDPGADRESLEALGALLRQEEQLTAAEWERFLLSLEERSARASYPGLPVPQEFGGCTLRWELARRERGVVYRARDAAGREVAVKVFRKDVPASADLPRVEGYAYVVSPFEEGESLEGRRLTPRRAADAVRRAAERVRERSHGALTPARLLVRKDDSVAVVGFEAARAVPPSARARRYAGEAGGDVRALGAILYEQLVGAPPAGEISPAARAADVPAELDRVVRCALSGGYASAGELADDLGRWLRGEAVTGRAVAAAPDAASRSRGRAVRWALAAGALLAAAAGVAALLVRSERPRAEGRPSPAAAAPNPERPPESAPPERSVPPPPPRAGSASAPLSAAEEERLQAEALRALGEGDYERILAVAGEALARGSKKDWPCSFLALGYLAREELDKAFEYVTRALEIAPGCREYLERRAEIRALRGEASAALAELEALYGRKAADLNRQIVRLNAQVEAAPDDAGAWVLRGAFYLLKRHEARAAEDFAAAIERGCRRALSWRARAWKDLGERGGGAADARAYLEEFPAGYAAEEMKALLREVGSN
jgi:tetratricopeptide (TPR) repeat protein